MAVGDIYRIFVRFGSDTLEGKERYTVEIGKTNLTVVLLDSITSQYKDKSDYIKLQYYPIRDWRQAGLKKSSYIDIRSTMSFDFREILKSGKLIGKLSTTDVKELTKFIQNYKERLEAHIKANPT
jgi:mRNA interferase MazF